MRIIKKIIIVVFELALAGVAFWLLFKLSWLFGHLILDGGSLVGHDSPFALGLVDWFKRWYPRIPLWYPLQGTGVSLFHSYPMLTTFLIIWINKITQLTDIEIFRILSFAVFPLTSFGIYVFARRKIGNSVAAFFAGAFFLLNQASWVFQRLHGIFAQSFSMVFVPWSFLFFDIFLERKLKEEKGSSVTRLALVLTVVFTALCFLAHPVTGMVVTLGFFSYVFFLTQFSLKLRTGFKKRLKKLFKGLIPVFFCLTLAVSLAAFWLIPFYSYNHLANREGLNTMGLSQLKEVSLLPRTLLGFHDFATGDFRYDYFFFALPVIFLSLIGLLGAAWVNRSIFSWGLIAFGAAIFTSLPLYLPALVNLFRYVFTAVYFRALMATVILLPVMAGFGAFFLIDIPFWLTARLVGKKLARLKGIVGGMVRMTLGAFRWLVVSLGVFLICFFFVSQFEHQPPDEVTQERSAYGVASFKAYGPTLEEDIEILKRDWQTVFLKKPQLEISQGGIPSSPTVDGFIKDFKLNETSRVDVSAYSGENFLQYAPMLTEATFVNLYHYSASLIHRMWGYQQGVFYGQEPLYDNPALLSELSRWFGTEYVVLVPDYDREENYQKTGWQLVKPRKLPYSRLPVYHFPEAEGLLTVSDRPVALVIGSFKDLAYDQVFRSSNAGAFSYDDLWLVEGGEQLDTYSSKELANFDLLILHGYRYKNKSKTWSLIKGFVEKGGKVFIDTGWQYVCSDWGAKNGSQISLPEPAPVEATSWGNVSPEWQDFEISPLLGDFETSSFKPFLWEGKPWGAALAQESQLRQGTEVLMRDKNGVVLAKRDFGKGTIIWSGLNLFGHAQGLEGEREVGVLRGIFSLLVEKQKNDYRSVSWQRDFPDELEIKFHEDAKSQWLLWREAFTPKWRVSLIGSDERAELYRGGPGFVLARLPSVKAGTTLRLEYRLGWFEGKLAILISGLTILVLISYLLIGGRTEGVLGKKFGRRLNKHWQKILKTISLDEKENY